MRTQNFMGFSKKQLLATRFAWRIEKPRWTIPTGLFIKPLNED